MWKGKELTATTKRRRKKIQRESQNGWVGGKIDKVVVGTERDLQKNVLKFVFVFAFALGICLCLTSTLS